MDLRTGGIDLIPAISANTRFRQIFAASNLEEQERIARGSGEALTFQQSWHEYLAGGLGAPVIDGRNFSEHITPRLRINDILLATDDPLQSIVQIRRGSGYAQYGGMPFVMKSTYHITPKEYDDRKKAAWPAQTEETLTPQIRDSARGSRSHLSGRIKGDVIVDAPPAAAADDFLNDLYRKQQSGSAGDDQPAMSHKPAPSKGKDKKK